MQPLPVVLAIKEIKSSSFSSPLSCPLPSLDPEEDVLWSMDTLLGTPGVVPVGRGAGITIMFSSHFSFRYMMEALKLVKLNLDVSDEKNYSYPNLVVEISVKIKCST